LPILVRALANITSLDGTLILESFYSEQRREMVALVAKGSQFGRKFFDFAPNQYLFVCFIQISFFLYWGIPSLIWNIQIEP